MNLNQRFDWQSGSKEHVIELSHNIPGASYHIKIRKFIPQPDDMLEDTWRDTKTGAMKRHPVEPYAICDMDGYRDVICRYIMSHITEFIKGTRDEFKHANPMRWDSMMYETYQTADRYSASAVTVSSSQIF